ncbi:MAG: MarR family transcriptional regulator, partial [Candidatus Micrarchaeota archaeon]
MALEQFCKGSLDAGQLAQKLDKKSSFISRVLKKLQEKGLVTRSGREISLSIAAHAQAFKKLHDSRPNAKIEEWLLGNSMSALLV